ncbi:gag-polypeptide of LTR copia-type [Phytophthora infestans]|uniref:Gag-polypeptide of LTR copia-type n=1 Tax=Phytophthora infestans TaxID=4787 RepID=A0A8S9TK86_PHYIN|nr:gag-polypeptide of LTR copia-type [Phytophthora infestans]
MSSLGSMTFGSERFDEARASTDLQYLSTWVERSRKAFTTLALSLSVQLRRTLDVERFEPCMDAPSQLWDEIRAHFEQGNGVNPTYLKAQMYNRRLQASENVDTFVQDMERRRRLLLDNGGSMEDWELADLLLSNSLLVFPQLAMDHTLVTSSFASKAATVRIMERTGFQRVKYMVLQIKIKG